MKVESNPTTKLVLIILGLVFLVDLSLIAIGKQELRVFSKTLLLPLLLVYFFLQKGRERKTEGLLFALGLFFSFLGDTFLLWDSYFLCGLGSFFLAHVLYSITFFKLRKRKVPFWLLGVVGIYLAGLVGFLYPHLGPMKVPVLAYAVVISVMFLMAYQTSSKKLLWGAVLFLISDSLLAISLFYYSSLGFSLVVMLFYVVAQSLLTLGILPYTGTKNA